MTPPPPPVAQYQPSRWIHFRKTRGSALKEGQAELAVLYGRCEDQVKLLIRVQRVGAAREHRKAFTVEALVEKREWCDLDRVLEAVRGAEVRASQGGAV